MTLSLRHRWVLLGTLCVIALIVIASNYHPVPPPTTLEQSAARDKEQTTQTMPPAPAGKAAHTAVRCDRPPFGMDTQKYGDLVALLGAENIHDLLRNTCRAKYMHDAKMRKALHAIGFSNELIDGNDVGYIALRVLQEFARTQR